MREHLALLLCCLLHMVYATQPTNKCKLYVAMSLIEGGGRGVFSGENIEIGGLIEDGITLTVSQDYYLGQLSNYVYQSEEANRSLVIFGVAMMFNHRQNNNAGLNWGGEQIDFTEQEHYAFALYSPTTYNAVDSISNGDEIFTHYGDHWFKERESDGNLEEIYRILDTHVDSNFELIRHREERQPPINSISVDTERFCLTNVYVQDSLIESAGRGLFSKLAHNVGDIVTISPALMLSKSEVIEASDANSVLINYCVCEAEGNSTGDVALFPFGLTAMINHASAIDETSATLQPPNAKIEWLLRATPRDENTGSVSSFLSYDDLHNPLLTAAMLSNLSFAPLDIVIRAIHPIGKHEEITIDYGKQWEEAWKADTEALNVWLQLCSGSASESSLPAENEADIPVFESHIDIDGDINAAPGGTVDCSQKPIFRQPIGAPPNMFPAHWK